MQLFSVGGFKNVNDFPGPIWRRCCSSTYGAQAIPLDISRARKQSVPKWAVRLPATRGILFHRIANDVPMLVIALATCAQFQILFWISCEYVRSSRVLPLTQQRIWRNSFFPHVIDNEQNCRTNFSQMVWRTSDALTELQRCTCRKCCDSIIKSWYA